MPTLVRMFLCHSGLSLQVLFCQFWFEFRYLHCKLKQQLQCAKQCIPALKKKSCCNCNLMQCQSLPTALQL